jgi:hypothetical protein
VALQETKIFQTNTFRFHMDHLIGRGSYFLAINDHGQHNPTTTKAHMSSEVMLFFTSLLHDLTNYITKSTSMYLISTWLSAHVGKAFPCTSTTCTHPFQREIVRITLPTSLGISQRIQNTSSWGLQRPFGQNPRQCRGHLQSPYWTNGVPSVAAIPSGS